MVESVGFENRCGGNPTGGSNPSLSAIVLNFFSFNHLYLCDLGCVLNDRPFSLFVVLILFN